MDKFKRPIHVEVVEMFESEVRRFAGDLFVNDVGRNSVEFGKYLIIGLGSLLSCNLSSYLYARVSDLTFDPFLAFFLVSAATSATGSTTGSGVGSEGIAA